MTQQMDGAAKTLVVTLAPVKSRPTDAIHPIDFRVLGITTWADHLNPSNTPLGAPAPGGCGGCGGCNSAGG